MTVSLLICLGRVVLAAVSSQVAPIEDHVRLSISADGDAFAERTAVPIRLEVHNETDEPLRAGFVLKPIFQEWVEILYRRVPNEFTRLMYAPEWDPDGPGRDHPAVEVFTIDARGVHVFPFSIATDPARGSFVFDNPGEYEVRVNVHRASPGRRTMATAPLRIRIEPAPPSEADALADWDVELATFAQNDGAEGGPYFRREVTRALKFMDAHPTSLYARLLRQRTYDTLQLLRRRGMPLSEYEAEAFERLERTLREVH